MAVAEMRRIKAGRLKTSRLSEVFGLRLPHTTYVLALCRSNSRNALFVAWGFTFAYCCVVRKLLWPIKSRKISASI